MALYLNKSESPSCKNDLYQVIEIGLLVLEKKVYNDFPPNIINMYKNSFPHCGPSKSLGTMICTSLDLHYQEVSCKSELFWPTSRGSQGDFFINPPQFCIVVIISPLERIWPLT
jgi:hypothetical protein